MIRSQIEMRNINESVSVLWKVEYFKAEQQSKEWYSLIYTQTLSLSLAQASPSHIFIVWQILVYIQSEIRQSKKIPYWIWVIRHE